MPFLRSFGILADAFLHICRAYGAGETDSLHRSGNWLDKQNWQKYGRQCRPSEMSEHNEHSASGFGRLLPAFAACYSFVVPLITPIVWISVLAATGGYIGTASTVASCLLASSLISGAVSLRGLRRQNGRKRYFWIAVVGIILSVVLGYFSLVFRSMPSS